jgi:hypothetical protein
MAGIRLFGSGYFRKPICSRERDASEDPVEKNGGRFGVVGRIRRPRSVLFGRKKIDESRALARRRCAPSSGRFRSQLRSRRIFSSFGGGFRPRGRVRRGRRHLKFGPDRNLVFDSLSGFFEKNSKENRKMGKTGAFRRKGN